MRYRRLFVSKLKCPVCGGKFEGIRDLRFKLSILMFEKNFTSVQMARFLDVSVNVYKNWMCGRSEPSLWWVIKLDKIFVDEGIK